MYEFDKLELYLLLRLQTSDSHYSEMDLFNDAVAWSRKHIDEPIDKESVSSAIATLEKRGLIKYKPPMIGWAGYYYKVALEDAKPENE